MRLHRNNRQFKIRNGFGEDYKTCRLAAWGDLAHSWLEYTQGDTFHLKAHEKISEMVLLVKAPGPASLIDLGCGPGHFLQMIKPRTSWKRVVGIDFCHKMLKIADAMDMSQAHRRARLPWQVFAELMQRALRPLAQARRHPEAFW
ncbi:MAG: class I SAM-dependent methyltransferase, partial [Verrucomicrobia bacterium]|nr:class I SAM-dependent methyltransferase [Verrucomicrobiota bacterium]